MGKYGSALGVWDLMVGRTEEQGPLQLHPTHLDNRAFLKIVMSEADNPNKSAMLDKIAIFLNGLIKKEYPPENDEEKKELEGYVGCNLMELMNETLITFKLAKREDLEEVKKQFTKKDMLPGI